MRQFRYCGDHLFLWGCALYAVNRWLVKPWYALPLAQNWFNDLLLIPCALPPMLWIQRRLSLRRESRTPTWAEIGFHLAIWSALFEWVGPHLMPRVTGDAWDAMAYAVGGLAAGWWWNRDRAQL